MFSLSNSFSRRAWFAGGEKQHNTVETAEIRYVYQPIESLYLLILTNKQSNIVEDLETLRLFTKVLNEYCPGEVDEANVCKNAFELVFAFDEIIALGHRENVSLRDIQANQPIECRWFKTKLNHTYHALHVAWAVERDLLSAR